MNGKARLLPSREREGEAPAEPFEVRFDWCTIMTTPNPKRLPKRTHPSHGVREQFKEPTIVLLTVCTKDRRPWLATPENHYVLREVWSQATAWLVGRYVIMPDHIHLFAGPGSLVAGFDAWVSYWKSQFTKHRPTVRGRWQPDHWDSRLRRTESYDAKWEYVVNNPVRHGLVERAEQWPYQGELNHLPW